LPFFFSGSYFYHIIKLTIDEFDEDVFEVLIKKVVVCGLDDDGNKIHHMLTFVFSKIEKQMDIKQII